MIGKFSDGIAAIDVSNQPIETFQDIFKSSVPEMVQVFQIRIRGQDNGEVDFKALLFFHTSDDFKKIARYAAIFLHAEHLVIIQDFHGWLYSRELAGHATLIVLCLIYSPAARLSIVCVHTGILANLSLLPFYPISQGKKGKEPRPF